MLEDEVWRLKKIGKTGAYHQALSDNGIDSVKKFLQAYMKDGQKLVKVKAQQISSGNKYHFDIPLDMYFHDGGLIQDLWLYL